MGVLDSYYDTNMDSVVLSKYRGKKKTTQQLTSMLSLQDIINNQIAQGNIMGNKRLAEKYIPKPYRKPIGTMMFVTCKINGKKVKALVDSGCNKTTLSLKTAERCGITTVIDSRSRRSSIGVGKMTDVGSIHFMIGKFDDVVLPFSLDVEDGLTVDMLLGLDFMEFHNVVINMHKNGLEVLSQNSSGFISFTQKLLYGKKPPITLGRTEHSIKRLNFHFTSCKFFSLKHDKNQKVSNDILAPWKDKKWIDVFKQQIKGANISENVKLASMYIPKEYQKPVPMLAIRCKINGIPIKAVIDSGCNSTVMSQKAADRCGLTRMMDLEGKGKAKGSGEGTTTVNGLLHFILIEVENIALPSTIAVIDDLPVELLLGLDIILHHMINIDLESKCLDIGSTGIKIHCSDFIECLHDGVMDFISMK